MFVGVEAVFTRPVRNIVRSGNLNFTADNERFPLFLSKFICAKLMAKSHWMIPAPHGDLFNFSIVIKLNEL